MPINVEIRDVRRNYDRQDTPTIDITFRITNREPNRISIPCLCYDLYCLSGGTRYLLGKGIDFFISDSKNGNLAEKFIGPAEDISWHSPFELGYHKLKLIEKVSKKDVHLRVSVSGIGIIKKKERTEEEGASYPGGTNIPEGGIRYYYSTDFYFIGTRELSYKTS